MQWFFSFLFCFYLSLSAVAPAPLQNYCPVVIVNSTTLNANQLYFLAHGNDDNGVPCFLVPDGSGICQYSYPTPSGTPSSASSSVLLSSLPVATGTSQTDPAYLIYLPINASSRAYISVNNPMYLATALNPALGILDIDDASVTSTTDPNYYTLYQDLEFGFDSSTLSGTQLYLNLSWVDYFCLPMQLGVYSYPSNSTITNTTAFSGFPPATTRESILNTTNTAINSGSNSIWGNLGLSYYLNPYTSTGTPSTYLRILAAKNSIGLGSSSAPFSGAATPQQFFPSTYAQSTTSGPATGTSYMQEVYTYYTSHTLYLQTIPAGGFATAVYAMTSDSATNLTLKFTSSDTDGTSPIYLDLSGANKVSSSQLLSGATWPFYTTAPPSPPPPLPALSAVNLDYTNELSKLLSGLFSIGQLPYPGTTSIGSPFLDNTSSFVPLAYFTNPNGYSGGPWYNLYSQGLHQQFISKGQFSTLPTNAENNGLGLAYAYDFDDLLGMSGIINAQQIQDQYGNPVIVEGASKPYVVMTLGSLSGTPIPDISTDSYTYRVVVGAAPNGVAVSFTYFNGTSTPTTAASTTTTTNLGSVVVSQAHPFQINFTFNSITYTYNLNLQRQIAVPTSSSSSFSTIDQYFQGGITFCIVPSTTNLTCQSSTTPAGSDPIFFINFNSFPPPWPG